MLNLSNKSRKDGQRFVEDVAWLHAPWDVPPIAARLYGHLRLCPSPSASTRSPRSSGSARAAQGSQRDCWRATRLRVATARVEQSALYARGRRLRSYDRATEPATRRNGRAAGGRSRNRSAQEV